MKRCYPTSTFETACRARPESYRSAMLEAVSQRSEIVVCFDTDNKSWNDAVRISSAVGIPVMPNAPELDIRLPGDAMAIFIQRAIGVEESPGCDCHAMRIRMNKWGWLTSWEKRPEIWDHVHIQAKKLDIEIHKTSFISWMWQAMINAGGQHG